MSVADEVFDMPSVKTLVSTCIDMLILGNDICSYNVEYVSESIPFSKTNL